MAETQRDVTEDWLPPPAARPPTVAELEQRIDVALAVARAAEAAALEIGAAALDAAEQARRAAELAERASARANGNGDLALAHFTERADRVVARLRAVGQLQ